MYVPEVWLHIGLYLSQGDLEACTVVCKAWCNTFTPLLYRTIDLCAYEGGFLMCGQPEQPVLIRHASHIRDLTLNLRSASAAPLVSKATSLHSLLVKAKIDPVALKSKVWITVKGLLKNNPHLYALQFDCLPHPYDIRRLPLDLSPSLPPRLMELRLKFAILDLAHLKGLSTLAVLDLQDCIIESYPHEREGPPMFPVLETLVLHGHGADYISHSALDWMAHCPRLKGLILVDYQPNPKMSSSISHWSPSLTLDSLRHSLVLDDERQAQLISKFPRLTSIMVQETLPLVKRLLGRAR